MDLVDTLTDVLRGRPEIELAYLFGSVSRGTAQPRSDIDVGVLVDPDRYSALDAMAHWGYDAALSAQLQRALARDDVDVVLLHRAPPLLQHEVIRDGLLLLARSVEVRVDFETRVKRRYLDTARLRSIKRTYMHERIRQGSFGRSGGGIR